jgi:hypothetical protein
MTTGDEPQLGGQPTPSKDAPSLPYDRKQLAGMGKNQRAIWTWLDEQGRAVTLGELYDWWTTQLVERYQRPLLPFVDDFNNMLSGLQHRGLVLVIDPDATNPKWRPNLWGYKNLHRNYTIEALQPKRGK